jgi:hypothetical protein
MENLIALWELNLQTNNRRLEDEMTEDEENVYLVIESGVDQYSIKSIHKTYSGAFEAWNKLRLTMIEEYKERIKYSKEDGIQWWADTLEEHKKHLDWNDPNTIAERCTSASEDIPIIKKYVVLP